MATASSIAAILALAEVERLGVFAVGLVAKNGTERPMSRGCCCWFGFEGASDVVAAVGRADPGDVAGVGGVAPGAGVVAGLETGEPTVDVLVASIAAGRGGAGEIVGVVVDGGKPERMPSMTSTLADLDLRLLDAVLDGLEGGGVGLRQ